MKLGLQPEIATVIANPIRAALQIGSVFRLSGHARESKVFAELLNELFVMLAQIVKGRIHTG